MLVSSLLSLLQKHTTEQLEDLFHTSGYHDIHLGTHLHDSGMVAHQCHQVSIDATTRSTATASSTASSTTTSPATPTPTTTDVTSLTFLEVEEQATTSSSPLNDLDCDCQPYSCTCRKQCFCRLSADPFNGLHYPPNANCPQCPTCDAKKKENDDDDDDDDGAKGATKPDYKCSCSFDGIGGAGISDGGFMNCDCRVADCSCSKQCSCTSKKKGTSGGGSSPSFKEVSSSVATAEVEENVGEVVDQEEAVDQTEDVVDTSMKKEEKEEKEEKKKKEKAKPFKLLGSQGNLLGGRR